MNKTHVPWLEWPASMGQRGRIPQLKSRRCDNRGLFMLILVELDAVWV
jgi:hypothetical protein